MVIGRPTILDANRKSTGEELLRGLKQSKGLAGDGGWHEKNITLCNKARWRPQLPAVMFEAGLGTEVTQYGGVDQVPGRPWLPTVPGRIGKAALGARQGGPGSVRARQ
ncbi:hypothetical protein GCM10009541_52740 [Micromonospora gifhornensis]|uniref:Uncharacterized protein n=1 Tax=Micromonospora gifhornensis TaxID=84594 RepID=A0ABQ4IGB9_9ACTN|nr:hypothetical protein Vgi01_36430 [Micromonospora gifhornensis]